MGYRGHDDWRDMSDYVVHFTKPNGPVTAYDGMIGIPRGLTFEPDDVAFLFVPEALHPQAAGFLANGGGGAGPAYACPILDPLWGDDQIQAALQALPEAPA